MNDLDERDDLDVVMEQALRERIGGETPPDLVDAVRARLHETPGADRSHRWLAAAGLLLGCTVVAGVAWWRVDECPDAATNVVADAPAPTSSPAAEVATSDAPPTPPASEQDPPAPPARIVTAAQAAALPVGTRVVEVVGGTDETIEALVPLRDLETLVVSQPWNELSGTVPRADALPWNELPKAGAMPKAEFLTNAVWPHFAKFTKLRRLELNATRLVVALGGLHGSDVVAVLEPLPGLESLALRHVPLTDALLERLPTLRQLRELELVCNRGFGTAGIAALSRCPSLRKLSLRGSFDLPASRLVALANLRDLEVLDLSAREATAEASPAVDPLPNPPNPPNAAEVQRLAKLLRGAMERRRNAGPDSLGSTVTDEVLEALSRMPKLRQVSLVGCDRVTNSGIRDLVLMPSLRVLDMREMTGVTADVVDGLIAAKHLEAVDLRSCPGISASDIERLQRARPDLKIAGTPR